MGAAMPLPRVWLTPGLRPPRPQSYLRPLCRPRHGLAGHAQWLIDLSELPDLLGARPVRSELVYLLVSLDKQYTAEAHGEPWEIYYARQILRHFQLPGN